MKIKENQLFPYALLGLVMMLTVGCTDSNDNTANNDSENSSSSDTVNDTESTNTDDTGTNTENDTGPDSQTGSETSSDTDSPTDNESESDSHSETDTDTASDSATGSDSDPFPDTDTITDSTEETDSGTHTDSETSSDTAADTGTDTGSDSVTDTESDTDNPNPWGFTVSNPSTHTLHCDDPANIFDGEIEVSDRHWLCTFKEGSTEGVLFIQAIPETCVVMMSPLIEYSIGVAEISIDGNLFQLDDVAYDSGGNHLNDSLGFTYSNRKYHYEHSSYGVGYRSCQNMDCANVSNLNDDVVENGCTCDRTRPIVCVKQAADGSFPPLVDTFKVCETDPDCGD